MANYDNSLYLENQSQKVFSVQLHSCMFCVSDIWFCLNVTQPVAILVKVVSNNG